MKRALRLVLAIIGVQAALIAAYWLVESRRSQNKETSLKLSTAPPQRAGGFMPNLLAQRRDGSPINLSTIERPTLVHFWATWCPPCRAELPGLLRLPDRYGVEVLAVALDRDWVDVERFLGRRSSTRVLIGDAAQVERQIGVRSLPVTYLVDPGGRLLLRFDDAHDWTDPSFLQTWLVQRGGD